MKHRICISELIFEKYLLFNQNEQKIKVIAQGYDTKLKIFLNPKAFDEKQKEI